MTTSVVRDATPRDAEALVRIRQVMLESFGSAGDGSWLGAARVELAHQLATGTMLGALAEDEGAVVSGALARVWRQLPGPGDDGTRAWIFSVATEPLQRRRGHARAVVTHLVDRLDRLGVPRVDLTASDDGDALYRSLGFAPSPYPLLRRTRPTSTPRQS